MNYFFKLFKVLFLVFLVAFLVGGLCIVLVQTVGLFTLDGERISQVKDTFAPWVFACATLCALSAFVLSYSREARAARKSHLERERQEHEQNRQRVEGDVKRAWQHRRENRSSRGGRGSGEAGQASDTHND